MALNLRLIGNAVRGVLRFLDTAGTVKPRGPVPAPARRPGRKTRAGSGTGATSTGPTGLTATYPGDFRGTAAVRYAPSLNGRPEPGEIVWTWVPFEEDHSRGKDRPVLLVGNSGGHLLGLMLTSKDHDGGPGNPDDYVDIGSGAWDRQRRPSEARLDRVLRVSPADVRREGAVLDAGRFAAVAAVLRKRHGWT